MKNAQSTKFLTYNLLCKAEIKVLHGNANYNTPIFQKSIQQPNHVTKLTPRSTTV